MNVISSYRFGPSFVSEEQRNEYFLISIRRIQVNIHNGYLMIFRRNYLILKILQIAESIQTSAYSRRRQGHLNPLQNRKGNNKVHLNLCSVNARFYVTSVSSQCGTIWACFGTNAVCRTSPFQSTWIELCGYSIWKWFLMWFVRMWRNMAKFMDLIEACHHRWLLQTQNSLNKF